MNVEFMLKTIETGIILLKYQVADDLVGFFNRVVKKLNFFEKIFKTASKGPTMKILYDDLKK